MYDLIILPLFKLFVCLFVSLFVCFFVCLFVSLFVCFHHVDMCGV